MYESHLDTPRSEAKKTGDLEMKKTLLGILALVTSQGAFATSLMGTSLQVERYAKAGGAVQHELAVYTNGTVVDRDFSITTRSGIPRTQVVARLNGHQMDRIHVLIRRSNREIMRFERTFARCFAPTLTRDRYTADNGSVKLRDGHICDGGFDYNARPAAQKLVAVLKSLERSAHTRQNSAQAEAQVDALLN